jgi:hypothetical protein
VDYFITGHFTALATSTYAQASRVVVCRLVLPEAAAAISARARDKRITRSVAKTALSNMQKDWKTFLKLSPTVLVCDNAAQLAIQHALKGADAVHLAAFLYFLNFEPSAVFFTTDKQLYRVANQLGPVVKVPGF